MSPQQFIINFILEKAEDEPIPTRIELYRGVAVMLPKAQRDAYRLYADQLEDLHIKAERTRKQLQLSFDEDPPEPTHGLDGQ